LPPPEKEKFVMVSIDTAITLACAFPVAPSAKSTAAALGAKVFLINPQFHFIAFSRRNTKKKKEIGKYASAHSKPEAGGEFFSLVEFSFRFGVNQLSRQLTSSTHFKQ
jgi:hypothetical protein